VLKVDADNSEALIMGGKLFAQLHLYDKAKQFYQQYLKNSHQATIEKFEYGMLHFDSNQIDDALQIWAEVLEVEPLSPPTLFYKGLAHAQKGEFEKSRECLNRLMQSAPADNLYFGKAKELLTQLNQDQSNEDVNNNLQLAKNAYKTIN